MKDVLKLLRVHHYIKNLLIFVPIFFGAKLFDVKCIVEAVWGFIAFSFVASAVYILNDLKDVEKDRNHPTKKDRPIASGRISKEKGVALFVGCLAISSVVMLYREQRVGTIVLLVYLAINIVYSCGLKNVPIIDVVLLSSGFVIRIIFGGCITGIPISKWLYLVVITGSFFMGLGKRRNELLRQSNTRDVLKYYNVPFLDKNMYVCVTLAEVFYAMWCVEAFDMAGLWTIPLFLVIIMKYSLDIESESDGDPIEVIIHDKVLIALIVVFGAVLFVLRYFM